MKTIKISDFAWNVNCPKCKELIETTGDFDLEDGEKIYCPHCNEPYRIKIVNNISEMF